MKYVKLTRGEYAIVDDEDFEKVSKFIWFATGDGRGHIYARRNANSLSQISALHNMIIDVPSGYIIDHINGNTLDNRKENLRVATYRQNSLNKGFAHNRKVKGVSWIKKNKAYRAYITPYRRQRHIGCFKKLDDAKRAYDVEAIKEFGVWARLNFPLEHYAWSF